MLTRTEAGRRSIPYRMIASVPSVTTFMTFFFIVVSTFAILGMQLFGGLDTQTRHLDSDAAQHPTCM